MPGGGWEEGVALVPFGCREFGDRRGGQVDRVFGEVRVGDVALHALDRQLARERAASAVLDRVAEAGDGGRFADQAKIGAFPARLQRLGDRDSAVHGVAFLVRGEQEGDRAAVVGVFGDVGFGGGDEGSQRGFHVRRAAAVEQAVTDFGNKGVALPLLARAGRHDVGVAGKAEERRRGTATRPEVADAAAIDAFAAKADLAQAFGDEFEAAGILRGDRGTSDQRAGQGLRRIAGHGRRQIIWHVVLRGLR